MEKEKYRYIILGMVGVVVLSIAYYFLYSLPSYNKERLEIELKKQEFEQEQRLSQESAKAKEIQDQKLAEELRISQLDDCLSDAQESYSVNWAKACRSKIDLQEKNFLDCKERWPDSNCEINYKIDEYKADCPLATSVAENVNKYLEDAKNECYNRFDK